MPSLSVSFDQYSDLVIDATVNFILTGPNRGSWSVGHCALGPIILQFGAEGGSKVLHGISRPDALTFILQDKQIADRMIFDGLIVQPEEFAVLPPASNFTIASEGSNRWVSATVPVALFGAHAAEIGRSDVADIVREKRIVSPSQQSLDSFISDAVSAAKFAREMPAPTLDGTGGGGRVVSALLTALAGMIAAANRTVAVPTSSARLADDTVTRALEYVRGQKWGGLQVANLALAADVTSRTLLRMFRQQLGMGPASYLKRRQLNIVRRALRVGLGASAKITDVMGEHGVTEFGRFASEYKALFGERPSDTVARLRAAQ
ncbi:MAG: helix-turn-helix domain-containing protein [Bradyrhizobium sp.]|nr:helix-turn-helix domain-containing protein [Bradyrhizobium sp.]